MKRNGTTILLTLVFLIGLSLLLYPTASDYWNSLHQSRAIASYAEAVAELDDISYEHYWSDAQAYNANLSNRKQRYQPTEEEHALYESLLNISGNGIMGYIGHIEGTSLPVGGSGTHCVVSGHRGLPSARLFTDLDKLAEGDTFLLRVLDEVLTYEVDQIHIVEPQEVDLLEIEDGQDLCTLVTCTPYGINSHRLLVRGHRIESQAEVSGIRVTADAMQIEPILVAPAVAAPMLFLLLLWLLFSGSKGRKKKKRKIEDKKERNEEKCL